LRSNKFIKEVQNYHFFMPGLTVRFHCEDAGDRVFPLILGSERFRNLRGLCLFIIRAYLTIGKGIRSNTLSPAIAYKFPNSVSSEFFQHVCLGNTNPYEGAI
jgi:hypothetical protein